MALFNKLRHKMARFVEEVVSHQGDSFFPVCGNRVHINNFCSGCRLEMGPRHIGNAANFGMVSQAVGAVLTII